MFSPWPVHRGWQDKGQMFLVRGGSLVVEKDGRRRSEIGTCIGDLVILGAEHQRPCTVRAQSFVFTLEIPRSALLQERSCYAIDRHPECRRALENYALQTIGQYEDQGGGVQWPMQKAAPQRLSYLLNLYAGVKLYDPAESDWKRLADESAVLVVQGGADRTYIHGVFTRLMCSSQGEALVMDEDGKEVEVLRIGDTFNEQILLGIPGGRTVSGLRFHIQTPCELQFVSLAVWEKVVSDFPQDQELIFRSIRDTMARKAAKKHGLSIGENLAGRPNERTGRGENLAQERLECWDEVAELFGPPIVPLSDHTSSVVGASLTSQSPLVVVPSEEKPDPIVEFMSRMEPTRAAVMRATKWSRVLSWGGYVFRAKRGRNFYQLSFEVKHVEDFVSHSWQTSPWKKVLLLLVIQNGRAAGLVGTVAALLMAILWHFHSLPAWTFTRWSHTGMPFSFWSSSVGFLTALVTLFSWRKQSSVFVDRVCVEGIISLGAILKSSSSMLVIWDESYVERLWCLFELAAFLKAHEEEAGRSERNGRSALRVKPLSLGWICVITSCALSVLSFHILVTPTDDSLMEWVIRLSCLTMLYTFIAVSRAHFRAMESAQQQLQCFRLEDATCWCCTVNHIDQDGPFTTCDRECVTKCKRASHAKDAGEDEPEKAHGDGDEEEAPEGKEAEAKEGAESAGVEEIAAASAHDGEPPLVPSAGGRDPAATPVAPEQVGMEEGMKIEPAGSKETAKPKRKASPLQRRDYFYTFCSNAWKTKELTAENAEILSKQAASQYLVQLKSLAFSGN
eukprot:g30275.t1